MNSQPPTPCQRHWDSEGPRQSTAAEPGELLEYRSKSVLLVAVQSRCLSVPRALPGLCTQPPTRISAPRDRGGHAIRASKPTSPRLESSREVTDAGPLFCCLEGPQPQAAPCLLGSMLPHRTAGPLLPGTHPGLRLTLSKATRLAGVWPFPGRGQDSGPRMGGHLVPPRPPCAHQGCPGPSPWLSCCRPSYQPAAAWTRAPHRRSCRPLI